MYRVDILDVIFVVRYFFGILIIGDKRSVMLIEFKMLFEEVCKSGFFLLFLEKLWKIVILC